VDVESVLAIVFIFGGGTLAALSFSPIGRAVADRIRGKTSGQPGMDAAIMEELERLRQQVAELGERVDFAERLLTQSRESKALPGHAPS